MKDLIPIQDIDAIVTEVLLNVNRNVRFNGMSLNRDVFRFER